MKKFRMFLTVLTLIFVSMRVNGQNIIDQGDCSENDGVSNVSWTLTDDEVLTISGTGKIATSISRSQWYSYRDTIRIVNIDSGITHIGNNFCASMLIEQVIIPNSVTYIGNTAFQSCTNLTDIYAYNVDTVQMGAFRSCSNIHTVHLNSIKYFGNAVFQDCINLTNLNIYPYYTYLGSNVFNNCINLSNIYISDSLKSNISGDIWAGCTSVNTIHLNNHPRYFTDDTFIFSKDTSVLILYASGLNLTTPIIPVEVQTIGKYAFYNSNIEEITIPSNITSIQNEAFNKCDDLREVYIKPITPPTISSNAFNRTNIKFYVSCGTAGAYKNMWQIYAANIVTANGGPQELYMVTVDRSYRNEIIWKELDIVQSYNIYRESQQVGRYDLIGNIPHGQPRSFIDSSSNALMRSYRYKISAIDTCGSETELSDPHKTMHLTINSGMNNSWNLIWTEYEGTNFSTYNIYRGIGTSTPLELIGTMPSSNTSFSDFGAPSTGQIYYMIEIVLDQPNNVPRHKSNTSIYSNIASNDGETSITNISKQDFKVYPNPTNGIIKIEGINENCIIEIYDIVGKRVETFSDINNINIEHFPSGIYNVKINDNISKIVKF
jgi:hypothetical protein